MVKILLPPSEGKAEGGDARAPWSPGSGVFGSALGGYRRDLADILRHSKGGSATLLGVSGKHLSRAQEANRSLIGAPTLPAWQRYTGVVWDHLDLASLPARQRSVAVQSILVVSGLAGLVRGDDPLPDYRLKIGARLAGVGSLARWWKPDITECLVANASSDTLVDLLPNEHRAAIDWSCLPHAVRVDLVSRDGGTVGGHNAKAAKGLLARHVLLTAKGSTSIRQAVKTFRHPAYAARIV